MDCKSIVKACIASRKGGIPSYELDDEYFRRTGECIPYRRLGYTSLYQFLRNINDIYQTRDQFGRLVLKAQNSKIAHINSLVDRQKDSREKLTRKSRMRECPYQKPENWNRPRKINTDYYHNNNYYIANNNNNNVYNNSNSDNDNYGHYPWWEKNNASSSFEEAVEFSHPRDIVIGNKREEVIHEPLINGRQLIGDDFFLQLAIRNIGASIWRPKPNAALHCGLCISGQTIRDCTRRLKKIQSLSNQLCIMLGSVDVYEGRDVKQMIQDMRELLEVLQAKSFSPSAITLCTIPPLANISIYTNNTKLCNLNSFNGWIRKLCSSNNYNCLNYNDGNYKLLDFQEAFSEETLAPKYDLFQEQGARRVSGTQYSYVLWNQNGRREALKLLHGVQREKCPSPQNIDDSLE